MPEGVPLAVGDRLPETELVYGPDTSSTPGLSVVRKVWVDPSGPFVRYTEIVTNLGADPVALDVTIATEMGSDDETVVVSSSNGDLEPTADDEWFVNSGDASDPAVGFWFGDIDYLTWAGPNDDLYAWGWLADLAAGETRTFVHFALLTDQPPDLDVLATALDRVATNPWLYTGMSVNELLDSMTTTMSHTAIIGGAGAVAPYAQLTATNESGKTFSMVANRDGSFVLYAGGRGPGETLTLIGSDGTNATIVTP